MNNKILFVFVFAILLLGSVSAVEWNDRLTYSNNDLKISLDNWWGLGKNIGTAELKSHKSVDEILKFGYGQEEVVMFYDFDFSELYIDGLGDVTFINKRTGEEVQKDYYFVKQVSKNIIVNDYKQVCGLAVNGTTQCDSIVIGNHTEERSSWERLRSNDIPNSNITIGLKTYVGNHDYIDAVWTIAGKQVEKHAEWTAGLNVNLLHYYKLNDTVDSLSTTNLTNNKVVNFSTGLIGNASDGGITNTGSFLSTTTAWDIDGGAMFFSAWLNNTLVPTVRHGVVGQCNDASDVCFFLTYDDGSGTPIFRWNRLKNGVADGLITFETTLPINGSYQHVAVGYDGTSTYLYFNGVMRATGAFSGNGSGATSRARIFDDVQAPGEHFDGFIDEVGVWNRNLTQTEITDLFNGGAGITFIADFFTAPTVNLNSPIDFFNTTNNTIITNGTVFDEVSIGNTTLFLDGDFNQTNTTTINNSNVIFTIRPSDGEHTWIYQACDDENTCTNASRTFTINTTSIITFISPTPINEFNSTDANLTVNFSVTEDFFLNLTIDLYNVNGALNLTVTHTNSSREVNWTNLPDGTYSYNGTVFTTTGQSNSSQTRNISIDANNPALIVSFPNETITFHAINTPLFVNWSVNDTNLDACVLEFQGVNTTVTCIDNQTTIDINNSINRSLTFYSNDTFGGTNSTSVSWNYRLFQESETFTSTILEGGSSVFSINFTTNGSAITIGNLSYNLTENIGTIVSSGNSFEINRTIIAPAVNSDTNISFFWNLTQLGGFFFSTASQDQLVTNIDVDDCTANTQVLYNFTNVDEITQVSLNDSAVNTTGDLNLQIFTFATTTLVINFSNAYTTNGFSVCLNDSLSGGENYNIDVQVQYGADDYSSEFFHIQNDTLNNDDFPTNITLFDLDNTTAQVFEMTFKDSSFLAVQNALIQIQRKYISEGVFKTVEIPKTDTEGETIAHLELEDVIYTFIVVKNGVVLSTFNNVLVECNPLLTTCKLNLNSVLSHIEPEEFTTLDDFSFTLDFDEDTRTITSIFTIPSSTVSTIFLNATLLDALGTTSACSDSLTSSSGTLTCTIPNSLGNASVFVQLSQDGTIQGSGTIRLSQEPEDIFGANLIFLVLFLYLTLIGVGISDSPMVMGIFLLFGAILGIALNLIDSTGFIGAGSTILWFFIAVVLVLIKGAKRT